jgi:Fe2+ transport system protein FeoA
MGWSGTGAFAAWHDVEEGREAEYLHWHSHEHMQERLTVSGFTRGCRFIHELIRSASLQDPALILLERRICLALRIVVRV